MSNTLEAQYLLGLTAFSKTVNAHTRFAEILELSERRIIDWCFVQAVLAWAWVLEDGCDTEYWEQSTRISDTWCKSINVDLLEALTTL